ncbi:MAG: cytochrome ubiquinol oxidase subunit I [Phycisphaerae bacterium]
MDFDVVLLSRIQFALTIMFHYIFPPLAIGLGVMLVYMEGRYLRTKDPMYETAARFWTKIFALNFAIGVASGIVMEFEFGTNWAKYSRFVGDVFGSALAAEGIFAFFLESGFLALLVFGWDRVSPRVHFFSTVMVALGSIFSSIWIVVANSWQQTPAGYHLVERTFGGRTEVRAEVTDFFAVVFNPSTVDRLVHVWIGALILGAFFVMSVAAYYILRNRHLDFAHKSFGAALTLGLIASVAMLLSGDSQARKVARTQPPKLAAFEGLFTTGTGGSPLSVFGIPDAARQRLRFGVAVPKLLSFLVYRDFNKPVAGLDQVPPSDRPPVGIAFQTYHVMVALGFFFIALTAYATWCRWRGTLFAKRWLLWVFVFAVIGPVVANELGWVAAEVGRQPWIVYGLLRTSEAHSEAVRAPQVLGSIILFAVIYALLFAVWIFVLDAKIRQGPEPVGEKPDRTRGRDILDAAAHLAGHGGSMTSAKEEQ